jgi:hypothetical protein
MNEYIEFKVIDSERFKLLQNVFQKIKNDKDNDLFEDEEFYLQFFDEQAKAYFGWYTAEEIKNWERKWFSTPIEARWNEPSLKMKWDFGSMIDSFKNVEYQLLSCEMISDESARINFRAFSHPYGGAGCMHALIESFGFEITEVTS